MAKALVLIGLLLASYFGPGRKVSNLESELIKKDRLEKQILFWEGVVTEKSNYRDGWLKLAQLYQQTSQNEKAKEAIQKVRTLDPGYPLMSVSPLP